MSNIKLQKNIIIRHRLKRAVQKGLIILSFLVGATVSQGNLSAHEIDRFASLNQKTKTKIILVQKENKDQYKTIFNQVKKAEEFIKMIYKTDQIDEKLVRKYITQANQLIDYFKSMKKEGYKFPRLIKGLKESKKLIVNSVLAELNSVTKLALSECKSIAYEKAHEWSNIKAEGGQKKAYFDAKKLIISNPNLIKAKKMIGLLKSLEIEDPILINAELIVKKIDDSLKGWIPREIIKGLEK